MKKNGEDTLIALPYQQQSLIVLESSKTQTLWFSPKKPLHMPKANSGSGDDDLGSLGPVLDFSDTNGAWYSARLRLHGHTLVVSYLDFSDSVDERFHAASFSTADHIAALRGRFRVSSPQLQDSQCPQLRPGMLVCAASCDGSDDSVLFFDAVVDSVKHERHAFNAQGEECLCTFIISWINGPKVGTLSVAKVDGICLIKPNALVEPRLDSFIRFCEEKLGVCPLSSTAVLHNGTCTSDYELRDEDYDLGGGKTLKGRKYRLDANLGCNNILEDGTEKDLEASTKCEIEDKRLKKGYVSKVSTKQLEANQSVDHNFFLIDNMEKDVAPSTIVNFIHKHTSIYVKAYIFPSIPSELFTRGAIVVDSAQKFEKLHGFLINSSDQLIISSKGRPWIVAYKSQCKSSSVWFTGSNIEIMEGNPGSELKIIRSGCQEYDTALQWRELIMEFKNHLKRLHGRLLVEEKARSALAGCTVDWL